MLPIKFWITEHARISQTYQIVSGHQIRTVGNTDFTNQIDYMLVREKNTFFQSVIFDAFVILFGEP